MEVVASISQGRTAAAQCGLFTYKSVPVTFEPSCSFCSYLIGGVNRQTFSFIGIFPLNSHLSVTTDLMCVVGEIIRYCQKVITYNYIS